MARWTPSLGISNPLFVCLMELWAGFGPSELERARGMRWELPKFRGLNIDPNRMGLLLQGHPQKGPGFVWN